MRLKASEREREREREGPQPRKTCREIVGKSSRRVRELALKKNLWILEETNCARVVF
jgi:hypothetical protein